MKVFIKNYNDNSDKEYILKVDVEYPKQLNDSRILIYYFHRKE